MSCVNNWLGEDVGLVVKEGGGKQNKKTTTLRFTQNNIFFFSLGEKKYHTNKKQKKTQPPNPNKLWLIQPKITNEVEQIYSRVLKELSSSSCNHTITGQKPQDTKGFGWFLMQFWTPPPYTVSPEGAGKGRGDFLALERNEKYTALHLYWWKTGQNMYRWGSFTYSVSLPPAFPDKVYPGIRLRRGSVNKQQGFLTHVSCQILCNQQINHFMSPQSQEWGTTGTCCPLHAARNKMLFGINRNSSFQHVSIIGLSRVSMNDPWPRSAMLQPSPSASLRQQRPGIFSRIYSYSQDE